MDMLRLASLTVALAFAAGMARAQPSLPPDWPPAGGPPNAGAALPGSTVGYCADLKRVLILALTRDRFAAIAGKPRDGSFLDTTLPLSGWKDCSLYGSRTYTCDSHDLGSATEAIEHQAAVVAEIKGCLGDGWAEDHERGSPTYVVVRSSRARVSMTISSSPNDTDSYVVRLTLFPPM